MTAVPGTRYLIDTSALSRARHEPVQRILRTLIDDGVALTCITIDLEAGWSARGADDLARVRATRRNLFGWLPLTAEAQTRAGDVQAMLAEKGLHRSAGPMDLLTAATAEVHRVVVLHYDADFGHIASVTGQRHEWIVPRGSLP